MNISGLGLSTVRGLRRPRFIACALAALLVPCAPQAASARAQQETLAGLARRSSIILRGTVLRLNASEEPQLAASANTLVIRVERMYAGAEIAGNQAGRPVTVILRAHRFKAGDKALFFGNPRYVGKTLTIASEGELAAGDPRAAEGEVERGIAARRDAPVEARLAVSDLVFRGRVESVRPLADAADARLRDKTRVRPSEHDPDWHAATVRVVKPMLGDDGDNNGTVTVVFAASRDIMWFNSPKLRPGAEAVFITHKPTRGETQLLRDSGLLAFTERESARMVTEPFDVLPVPQEGRVRQLLLKEVR
jgi:hypothetical protein